MAKEPNGRYGQGEEEEYRKRVAAKAKRRKKKQQQRLILIGAFVLGAALLVLCIVMVFRAILGGDESESSSVASQSVSASAQVSGPGVSWPVATDPTVWNLILVNRQNPLPEGFTVETASVSDIGHRFDARAADTLKAMMEACNTEVAGGSLSIYSGYRGAQTQNDRYQYLINQGISEDEAWRMEPPSGYSEHQTGLAVDFVTGTLSEPTVSFAETPEFTWLVQNAHKYGFILRYPSEKEEITGVAVQPYHFRYVGVDDATIITNANICLEEYLAMTAAAQPESQVDSSAASLSGTSLSGSEA